MLRLDQFRHPNGRPIFGRGQRCPVHDVANPTLGREPGERSDRTTGYRLQLLQGEFVRPQSATRAMLASSRSACRWQWNGPDMEKLDYGCRCTCQQPNLSSDSRPYQVLGAVERMVPGINHTALV